MFFFLQVFIVPLKAFWFCLFIVSRKRKKKNWEDEDFYDSDDDPFLDRTGVVEKKRTERMKKAGKMQERPDTYESLVRNQHHVSLVIFHAPVLSPCVCCTWCNMYSFLASQTGWGWKRAGWDWEKAQFFWERYRAESLCPFL